MYQRQILFFFILIILFFSHCKNIKIDVDISSNKLTTAQKTTLHYLKKNYQNNIIFPTKEGIWEKALFYDASEKKSFVIIPLVKNKKLVNFFLTDNEYLVFYLDAQKNIFKQEIVMFVADKTYFKRYENIFLQALMQPQQIVGDYTGYFFTFDLFSDQTSGNKYLNGKKTQSVDYQINKDELWLVNTTNILEKQYLGFFQAPIFWGNEKQKIVSFEDTKIAVHEYLHTYLKNFREDSTAKTHQLILYLYEPAPNSHIGYFFAKVGHIYIALEQTLEDNTLIRRSVGFWPDDLAHPWHTKMPALIEREDWQKFTIKINIPISKENFVKLKNNIIKDNIPLPIYDLEKFNCVDWIVAMLKKIDIFLPPSRVSWGFGGASTTGVLGYALRKKYSEKKMPKDWQIEFAHFGFLTDNLH
ncbi:MAG: hypothetical protein EAZ85_08610 [Bacteroidetes bacterium]|nr:MAG: hypothetical protein EAZ85_08610 [Bacteroidota bacterium]TAG89064.1 MAG: hypothetical protein EAZ20_07290 [Bacteroidota bacterium]